MMAKLKLTVLFLGVASIAALGQTVTSTIVGDVTDAQNAVVPEATISVKSVATGLIREVRTTEAGSYRVYPLSPSSYEVTVNKPGFRPQTVRVTLEVAQTAKVDFQLDVGQLAESVTVEAVATVFPRTCRAFRSMAATTPT